MPGSAHRRHRHCSTPYQPSYWQSWPEYLEQYYRWRSTEIAAGTLELHRQTGRYLLGFFGEGRRLDAITKAQAEDFRNALAAGELAHVNKRTRGKPLAANSVNRHLREAKTIFAMAVDRDLLAANPFKVLKTSKVSSKADWHYVTPEEFDRSTRVTYLGTVLGTRAALRRMLPRDRGSIVQVGSAMAYRGIPLQAPYCGAKHAINGFTESLRTELLHEGSNVQVTEVQLPAMNTPQFSWSRAKLPKKPQPVPPIFQPEVAAEAIVHAADHPRRELAVA